MKRTFVPVEVSSFRDPDGQQHMVSKISLGQLMSDSPGMAEAERKLSSFTKEYLARLARCKEELRQVGKEKKEKGKVNPLLFWRIGDHLLPYFNQQPGQDSLVLSNPYGHFARDLPLSKSTLGKIVTFRRRFATPQAVDTSKTWDYYRESKYLKEKVAPPSVKVTQQEKREAIALIKLAVPEDAGVTRLSSLLQRWLSHGDDSSLLPSWLVEEGIELQSYEVFLGKTLPSEEKT